MSPPHPAPPRWPPDLVSKEAALAVTIGGKPVSVGGMCKGSGMIHPNMATMLGVVTTDAEVDTEVWRGMLRRATDASFNAVRRFGRGAGLRSCWRLLAPTGAGVRDAAAPA